VLDSDEIQLVCPLGTVLRGKYRLDRVLGIGGMAVVYAATHRNQKRFAIKVLHTELSMRQDIRVRFLREGYAANSVDHPGAVAVLDDDVTEDGAAFLVMELLEGESVEHLWEKHGHKFPVGAAVTITHQLMDILAVAHAKAIVHRDIKPANLFVTHEGQLKVLDFGIARVRDAAISGAQATGTGLVLGTPAFMSPEQALAKSQEIDARTDVWAAGATLFTLLTGRNVHEGENAQQVLIRAATTPAPPIATVAPHVPSRVGEVVDRALAFDRHQRWASAEAMRDALRDAHVAVFGGSVTRESMIPLVSASESRLPPTRHSEPLSSGPSAAPAFDRSTNPPVTETLDQFRTSPSWGTSRQRGRISDVTPTVDATALRSSSAPPRGTAAMTTPPVLMGGTTAQPIARDKTVAGVSHAPRRRPLLMASASVGLAGVGGGVALWIWSMARTGSAVAVPAAGALPTIPSSPPSTVATASASPVALTPLPSATAVIPSAAPSSKPVLTPPPPATPRATPALPAPPSPRPQCNPPYVPDPVTGVKHWKPECL
jgi:serine/threonine-protein kinase